MLRRVGAGQGVTAAWLYALRMPVRLIDEVNSHPGLDYESLRMAAGISRSLSKISGNGVASQTSGNPGLRVGDGVGPLRFKGILRRVRCLRRWKPFFASSMVAPVQRRASMRYASASHSGRLGEPTLFVMSQAKCIVL